MKLGFLLQQGINPEGLTTTGPANHVQEVASGLRRTGHDVKLLNYAAGVLHLGPSLTELISIHFDGFGLAPKNPERLARRLQRELKLPYLNLFESLRFGRAVQHTLADRQLFLERLSWVGLGGTLAAKSLNIPLVLEYNGDPLHDLDAKGIGPNGIQRELSRMLMRWALLRARHIVASGEGWRRQLIQDWGISPRKVSAISNGTNLVEVLDRKVIRAFKELEGEGFPRFVYLGGFQPWQGVGQLLDAFHKVRKELPKANLTLVGDGPGLDAMKARVDELGLQAVVEFTGGLAPREFGSILAQSDIGLSPYCGWVEYEGLKVFDYKAAGLATIASGKDGQPRSISPGQTGLIVTPCDRAALTRAMIDLGSNPQMFQAMGRQARLEAEQEHSWSSTCQQLESLLEELLVQS